MAVESRIPEPAQQQDALTLMHQLQAFQHALDSPTAKLSSVRFRRANVDIASSSITS